MISTQSQINASSTLLKRRIDRLLRLDLRFVPSSEIQTMSEDQLQQLAPEEFFQQEGAQTDSGQVNYPLLTPAAEAHLFRCWNFMKCRASRMRARLTTRSRTRIVQQIEQLWQQAQAARDQLVQSNQRLVISLAKKYASTSEETDDFISEGNLILVNAIDKFDYSRGYRFSTYATHAIQRHFFRLILRRQRRQRREIVSSSEVLSNVSAPAQEGSNFNPQLAQELIHRFDECLNAREKSILEQRFGLHGEPSATLKTIAENVGLSKERVRQLQLGAIEKLSELAMHLRLRPETCL